MKLVTYLLPLSGRKLLSNLVDGKNVSVEAAFLPESYVNDCGGSLRILQERNIPYRTPSVFDEDLREWLQQFELDIGLSVGYDKQLPEWVFSAPEMGTLNLHPSLLPRYRGANPYFWVIKNRKNETGVTLHFMDDGMDTGPIVDQQRVQLDGETTVGELFDQLNTLGIDRMLNVVDELEPGDPRPEASPQPSAPDAPTAPKLQDRDLRLDWSQPFGEIDAQVRAGNPHFGTFTTFKGSRLRIYEVSYEEGDDGDDDPSTIQRTDRGPLVRCADGWACLEAVQVDQRYYASGLEFQRRESKALNVLNRVV